MRHLGWMTVALGWMTVAAGWLLISSVWANEPPPVPGLGPAGDLERIEFETAGQPVLRGNIARKQLLVTGIYSSGQRHDLTRAVRYEVDRPEVLQVAADGLVTPLSDGTAVVTARAETGQTASIQLVVEKCQEELPVNFVNEIVPIFTKLGCNSGGCHGKSDGQNGFKLSLLGFYPDEDYEYLVYEDRGRRVFPAAPDYSLLLLKPANILPHGGGQRLTRDSYEWQLISRWIGQGMPYGSDSDPVIERIEVVPARRAMNRGASQQLAVIAYYSDGSTRDVTRLAKFEANDQEMAFATDTGLVTTGQIPGEVAVMVRFQGAVAVFRAVIPLGLPIESLPAERTLVDRHVFAKWRELGIPPSPICDDATFIRRVTIDIAGRLPTIDETRAFLADSDPAKRDRLIDRLLDSPDYADYFANKWAAVLRNKRTNGNDTSYTYRFHAWIRRAFLENMPYDQFVRNVLCATGTVESHPPVAWYREVSDSTQQMEDTAQLFLGLRLQCAKCHHHPFERWSQQDYYGFEAFFRQVELRRSSRDVTGRPDEVVLRVRPAVSRNPRTGKDVPATGLGGEPLQIAPYEDARQYLVDWMTDPKNPFFARALVNRYWKHFFGRGIVDPEDDMRVTNPPSNPELLEALAKDFVEHGYDLKHLIRTICRSSTYQLSPEPNEYNALDKQNFSSFYPRRMPAEVLYDAINQVAGVSASFGGLPQSTRAVQLPDNGFNNYFLTVFGKPEARSACECERSVEANLAQSLHLLNSAEIQGRIGNGNGRAAKLARDQERSDADKITEVYLAAFSRLPTQYELDVLLRHVSLQPNKQQAYEDVIWAVINTKEFQFIR
ncbi:MAG: S-layer protein [Pirellulaceae bacterium]|nr:MAG: S-layer protein [Pirellulaceae bacterium]